MGGQPSVSGRQVAVEAVAHVKRVLIERSLSLKFGLVKCGRCFSVTLRTPNTMSMTVATGYYGESRWRCRDPIIQTNW